MRLHVLSLGMIFLSFVVVVIAGSIILSPKQNRPHIRLRHGVALNWAGYAVATNLTSPQSNAVTDVVADWIVPTVSCPIATSYSATWLGIDGYDNSTVEQIGTEQDCSRSRPTYYAWYEMYPQFSRNISLVVHPGDIIHAEVKYIGSNRYTLNLKNNTTGKSYMTTQRLSAQRKSAEWIIEAPSSFFGILPLANFGTQQFLNVGVTINNHTGTITDSAWQDDPISMETSASVLEATPSALTASGSAFSVQRQ